MKKFFGFSSLLLLLILFSSCSHFKGSSFGPYSEAEDLYQQGKYEKAIAKYQEYIDENPEGNMAEIAIYYQAKSYAALGKTGEARNAFQKVIDTYPEEEWAAYAKEQLEKLSSCEKASA